MRRWQALCRRMKSWRGLCDIHSVLCYFIPLASHSHSSITNDKRIRFTAKQGCSIIDAPWFVIVLLISLSLSFCRHFCCADHFLVLLSVFYCHSRGLQLQYYGILFFFFFTFDNIFNFCRTPTKRWKIKMEQIWHQGLYIYIYIVCTCIQIYIQINLWEKSRIYSLYHVLTSLLEGPANLKWARLLLIL